MSRIASFFAAITVALLLPATSHADEQTWLRTFTPRTLATYHPDRPTGLLVVGAGPPGQTLEQATNALREAYVKAGLTDLVMDAEALGSVTDLADAQIVKKAKNLPISHVVILRIFSTSKSAPETAVVTIYDKWGSAYGTFKVRAGGLLERKKGSEPPPYTRPDPVQGPGQSTTQRPAAPVMSAAERARLSRAEREFDDKQIWYASPKSDTAFIGIDKKKKQLEGKAFYLAAGRKDLAAKYKKRNQIKWGLILGGLTVTAGGIAYPLLAGESCDGLMGAEFDDCQSSNDTKFTTGSIVAGVGVATWLVGWFLIDPHPVSGKERRKIVDKHNNALRRGLGLSASREGDTARDKAREVLSSIRIAPQVNPTGGGLMVTGRF